MTLGKSSGFRGGGRSPACPEAGRCVGTTNHPVTWDIPWAGSQHGPPMGSHDSCCRRRNFSPQSWHAGVLRFTGSSPRRRGVLVSSGDTIRQEFTNEAQPTLLDRSPGRLSVWIRVSQNGLYSHSPPTNLYLLIGIRNTCCDLIGCTPRHIQTTSKQGCCLISGAPYSPKLGALGCGHPREKV